MMKRVKPPEVSDVERFQQAKRGNAAARLIAYDNAWAIAIELAKANGWEIRPGVHMYRNAAKLIVNDMLQLPFSERKVICEPCRGAGAQGGARCPNCGGYRYRILTHAEMQIIVGATPRTYASVWMPRLETIRQAIRHWSAP
jgi:hypothetical protein